MSVVWKLEMREEEMRAVLARALVKAGRTVVAYDPVSKAHWMVGPRGWARGYMASQWADEIDRFRGGVVSEDEVPLTAIVAILVRAAGIDTEEALKEVTGA